MNLCFACILFGFVVFPLSGCGQRQAASSVDTNSPPVTTELLAVDSALRESSSTTGFDTVGKGVVPIVDTAPASMYQSLNLKAESFLSLDEDLNAYSLGGARLEMAADRLEKTAALQDDNLLTHVECSVSDDSPCVVDIRLPAPCMVKGVRLFSGDGSSRKAYVASGRAKQIRIRADESMGEITLDDHWDFSWVMFDTPVMTQSIRLEILSIYGKKRTTEVSIAELDVLGETGASRPPLHVDWSRLYTKTDGDFWRGDRFQDSWIEQIDIKGNRQRLFRGTVVHGGGNRRFLLSERFVEVTCPGAMYYRNSRYTLVDTRQRLMYALPLRVQGAVEILPLPKREGFFIKGFLPEDGETIYQAVAVSGEAIRFETLDSSSTMSIAKESTRIGFTQDMLRYGESEVNAYGSARPCKLLRRMKPALKKKAAVALDFSIEQVSMQTWEKCEIPDGRTVYLHVDMCDEEIPAAVIVTQTDGSVLGKRFSTYELLELRVFGDGSVRISAERKGGIGGDIYDVNDAGELKLLIKDALFLPGPAPGCRCSA